MDDRRGAPQVLCVRAVLFLVCYCWRKSFFCSFNSEFRVEKISLIHLNSASLSVASLPLLSHPSLWTTSRGTFRSTSDLHGRRTTEVQWVVAVTVVYTAWCRSSAISDPRSMRSSKNPATNRTPHSSKFPRDWTMTTQKISTILLHPLLKNNHFHHTHRRTRSKFNTSRWRAEQITRLTWTQNIQSTIFGVGSIQWKLRRRSSSTIEDPSSMSTTTQDVQTTAKNKYRTYSLHLRCCKYEFSLLIDPYQLLLQLGGPDFSFYDNPAAAAATAAARAQDNNMKQPVENITYRTHTRVLPSLAVK